MEGLTAAVIPGGPGNSPSVVSGGPSGVRAARRLLELARLKESLARERNPFPPLVHLLVNIFFCALAERYLADDPDGVYLPLFVAIQCLLGVLITLAFIGRSGMEILKKTRLLPGSSSSAYYFLLAGSFRRPEFYLFTAVGCLFPAVVHAPGLFSAAAIVILSAQCVLTAQILCCAASVRLIRSSRPLTGIVFAAVMLMGAVTASVFVFRAGALASSLPVAGWAASGIAAFASGETSRGLEYVLILTAAAAAAAVFFRK